MGKTKDAILTIRSCQICYGKGYNGWVSSDGDFDFEFCECNPFEIILEDGEEI